MIKIIKREDCCGCAACVQRCPHLCITLQEDEEGFLYPIVDKDICIDCGLCQKVCPALHQGEKRKPLHVYAAKNKNERIRMKSSSGGIFTSLAEQIIADGGVVFGARFNKKWEVVHDYTETIEGLAAFRGSKYVQSYIGNTFQHAEQFLKRGRKVLFSGSPCQIAGLKLYLRKSYEHLLTIDFICHGVPSPMIWQTYLKETLQNLRGEEFTYINFREKDTGWENYNIRISYKQNIQEKTFQEHHMQNLYLKGFLTNLYLRPSCYACPTKCQKSGSDITLGDFWKIHRIKPEINDNKGVGAVLVNTEKGKSYYVRVTADNYELSYRQIYRGNHSLESSVSKPNNRTFFFQSLQTSSFTEVISSIKYKESFQTKCKVLVYKILSSLKLIQ